MNRAPSFVSRLASSVLATALALSLVPGVAHSQDEAEPPPVPDSTKVAKVEHYANLYAGEFTPGSGFDIVRTKKGTLNISVYGVFRYINQLPGDQTFTDHLGRVVTVKARNDLNWHRTFVWLTGWFGDPKFRYNITMWSLPTTQQTLLFGNLRYLMSEKMTFGVGIGPNLTNRSLQGSWPYWAGSDRQMGEEFIRGGFSSAFFITGRPVSRLLYTVSVNNNLSQLGVTATNDTRNMSFSGSLNWQPTTGEFGPRNGFGDFEHHDRLATQFGVSACNARENRFAPINSPSNETQIRLSDGLNPFEADALVPGVTVDALTYRDISLDAGAKYRGFSFQSEYTYRVLSDFSGNGAVPIDRITDRMVFGEAMHMVVPKKLGVYAVTSYAFDEFQRNPWELGGGASLYPYGSRQWRLNLHVLHVVKSPASSNFGYYTAGQTGTTISLGTDILL